MNGLIGVNMRWLPVYTGIIKIENDIHPVFLHILITPLGLDNPAWITNYKYILTAFWIGLILILFLEHLFLGKWQIENAEGSNRWIPSFLSLLWLKKGLFIFVLVFHICVLLSFVLRPNGNYFFNVDHTLTIILLVVEGLSIWLQLAVIKPFKIRKLFRRGHLTKGLYKEGEVFGVVTRKSGNQINVMISYEYDFQGKKIFKTDAVFRPERFLLIKKNESELDIFITPSTGKKSILVDNFTY